MELITRADVVLALGTRLNPFSTLPGYGIDYWPKDAKIIQVDLNPDRIGLTKPVAVGIVGDAKRVAEGILAGLSATAGDAGRADRLAKVAQTKSAWAQQLSSMDHEDDDAGTDWNDRARKREPEKMSPRMAWRAIQSALPREAIISSDIGNNCAIGNAYPTFEPFRPLRLRPAVDCRCKDRPAGHTRRGFRGRRGVRHFDERDVGDRARRMARDHDGDLPQLPVGGGKAEHDAVVRR